MLRKEVSCEYFLENGLCYAIKRSQEGKSVRNKHCVNALRNVCCCLCPHTGQCEISCFYLIQAEDGESQKSIGQEIKQCKRAIEKLSVYLAQGKITGQSYLISIAKLEKQMEQLDSIKEKTKS